MIAGDIFDKWKVSPDTVNRAIEMFHGFDENVYAVPGQHDLRHHNYADLKETSYWTLVKAKVITDMKALHAHPIYDSGKSLIFHPFWWRKEVTPRKTNLPEDFHIAVVHKYIWAANCGYQGAPEEAHLTSYRKALKGYHLAVFGDNHKGFYSTIRYGQSRTWVVNCGGFMHRKSDEKDYEPAHAVMYEDGTVEMVSSGFEAQWVEDVVKEVKKGQRDVESLLEVLTNLGEQSLDFREAMNRYMEQEGIGQGVRKIVLEAME